MWAISNTTTSAEGPLIVKLIDAGMINSLVVSLKLKSVKMVAVALEGLSTLLEMGAKNFMKDGENLFALEIERVGGLEALEELQHHQNQYIYEQAFKVLKNHFMDDEQDDLGLAGIGMTDAG